MCIFSQPASVQSTQIFARMTSQKKQFIAYQMSYQSQEENAMILPLPMRQPAHSKSLRFIDLQNYNTLFDDLEDGFPYTPEWFNVACSDTTDNAQGALKLFKVGNYIASFVPSLSNFNRLDSRFTLPKKTWAKIPQYANYGFAVFQLASGNLKPHPMAFEYENDSDSIYFPTLHIHDGEVHPTEDFDHILYLQHAGFDSKVYGYQNAKFADKATELVRSKYTAGHFCDVERSQGIIDSNLLVHRHVINGSKPNQDTLFKTSGDPETPTWNFRPWIRHAPWLVLISPIVWLYSRRLKVAKMEDDTSQK